MSGHKLSGSELSAAEKEHQLAHESLRNDFANLLGQTVDRARKGENVEEAVAALIEAYNSSSKSTVRVMTALRRLQNS